MQSDSAGAFRRVAAGLAAALVMLLAGSAAAHAQSRDPEVGYFFRAETRGLDGDIACTGENVQIDLTLYEARGTGNRVTSVDAWLVVEGYALNRRGTFPGGDRGYIGMNVLAPGEVTFSYAPRETGMEKLTFDTLIPPSVSGLDRPILVEMESIEFEVVDCAIQIEAIYDHKLLLSSIDMYAYGYIPRTELKPDDLFATYSGESTLSATYLAQSAICDWSFAEIEALTQYVATVSDNTIQVDVTYAPAEMQTSVACQDVSASALNVIDLNGIGLNQFTVPARGGIAALTADPGVQMVFKVTRSRGR